MARFERGLGRREPIWEESLTPDGIRWDELTDRAKGIEINCHLATMRRSCCGEATEGSAELAGSTAPGWCSTPVCPESVCGVLRWFRRLKKGLLDFQQDQRSDRLTVQNDFIAVVIIKNGKLECVHGHLSAATHPGRSDFIQ